MREGESVDDALRRLRAVLQEESIEDQFRRRWWRVEYYQKPGYRRRQQKFFAKVVARREQRFRQILIAYGLA